MGIMKYAIMGGVAGGATAAVRQRRVGETADILLWGKEPHISCANYGLPHCMGSVIVEHEKLLAQNEMFAIHPKNQTITIRNAGGGRIRRKLWQTPVVSGSQSRGNLRWKAFALEVSLHCAM